MNTWGSHHLPDRSGGAAAEAQIDVTVVPHEGVVDDSVPIDCGTCEVRGLACGDCVVTVLLGGPPEQLDAEEQRALGVLADSGLVPPLRLVRNLDGDAEF